VPYNLLGCLEFESALPRANVPASAPSLKPDKSSQHPRPPSSVKTNSNNILPSTTWYSKRTLSVRCSDQIFVQILYLCQTCNLSYSFALGVNKQSSNRPIS